MVAKVADGAMVFEVLAALVKILTTVVVRQQA